MSFLNKVAIVTGASSGIGAATAILFAKEGASLTIVGRNQTKLKAVTDKIAEVGKKPHVIIADLSKDEEVKRIVHETVNKFGKLDVLVNNAGFATYGSITDGNILKSYDEVMNVNVRAVISLTTEAAPHLKETKGCVVNISSAVSLKMPQQANFLPYSISKAAVDYFTKGAASELAEFGVRVNSVNPGPVMTDFFENTGNPATWDQLESMTALKRNSTPDEIADMVAYLAGHKARGITGSIFVVDNGYVLK